MFVRMSHQGFCGLDALAIFDIERAIFAIIFPVPGCASATARWLPL
jgi:hypothetical protein